MSQLPEIVRLGLERLLSSCPVLCEAELIPGSAFSVLTISVNERDRKVATATYQKLYDQFEEICIAVALTTPFERVVLQSLYQQPLEVGVERAMSYMGANELEEKVDAYGGIDQVKNLGVRAEALLKLLPQTTVIVSGEGEILASNALEGEVFPGQESVGQSFLAQFSEIGKDRLFHLLIGKSSSGTLYKPGDKKYSVRIQDCGESKLLTATEVGATLPPIRIHHLS